MQNKELHIVFLTPGFPSSENDSITIPAFQIYLKALLKKLPKIKITVLSFQYPYTNKPYIWNGANIIPLNGKNLRLKKIWTWNKALKTLEKIHQKNPIIALHSLWIGECSFIGNKIAKKLDISHIITVMGQDAFQKSRFDNYFIHSKTVYITLSKNQQQVLFNQKKIDSKIIPWTLDYYNFPEISENKIDILGVGSLNSIKNYTLFIEIIASLVKEHPKLKVEIIGEGKKRSSIEKLIKLHNINTNIKLLGLIPREQVLQKMSKSNILLHTSNYESFGYAFSEALYAGMKVVSYNVGIAKTSTSWKICNTKEDFIVNCNSFLLHSKKTKMRYKLYENDTIINSYLNLYK